jgi:uncharacterized membrane protein YfcA
VEVRQAAAISAMFNLLNSAAALIGTWATTDRLPEALPWWLLAVGIGGLLGSWLATRHLPVRALRYLLAGLLAVSGVRMVIFS